MVQLLRRIYRKVFPVPVVDPVRALVQNRGIVLGKDCKIEQLQIDATDIQENGENIVIGDDCYLMCNIVLHSRNAKVKIGNRVFIGPGTTLFCYDSIEIKDDVMISWGCTLIDTNAHSLISDERMNDVKDWKMGWQHKNWSVVESRKITVHSKSWIGFNSIIVKGVELKEGTVVAAGSVVTKSSEPYSVIGGNPAVFIKQTS